MIRQGGDLGAWLQARWEERFPGRSSLGTELINRYSGVVRVYHDLRHLADLLRALDLLTGDAADELSVELAGWFHDAVYDVGADDNEDRSAQLAETCLPAYDFDDTTVAEVARLVRLTQTHDPTDGDANGVALCDADLSVLAGSPDEYDEYTDRVRTEYRHLADPAFRTGRIEVLRRLLDLPVLFHSSVGHDRWERPARANLARELAHLTS